MNPLDLRVEDRFRVDHLAGRVAEPVGEPHLGRALGQPEGVAERGVLGQGEELLEQRQVDDPVLADDVGDEPREVGVRQQEPAPRRHAVGLVVEAAGELLGQVAQHGRPEQLRVERGDAVGAVRADDGQVGHADPLLGHLLDQADAADPVLVAGVARAHVVEEAAVDLVDDLEMPGQADLEEGDRPGLQGLGQQGMIGVGERPDGQVPRLVPAQPGLIQQDAHQLGDGQRRVGVVELDRDLLGQRVPVVAPAAEPRHDIGQRAGDQEILLDEPQALAAGRRVVGIEDPRERLGGDLLVDGVEEVAAAEFAEVEVPVRRRAPESQRVDRPAAVADDRPVIRQAHEGRRRVPDDLEPTRPSTGNRN